MKHTKRQTEALWASAEHWLENWSYPKGANIYGDFCPCCQEFMYGKVPRDGVCTECPISQWSGQPLCEGTPWENAAEIFQAYKKNPGFNTPKFTRHLERLRTAFEAEYRFLVRLALGEDPDTED